MDIMIFSSATRGQFLSDTFGHLVEKSIIQILQTWSIHGLGLYVDGKMRRVDFSCVILQYKYLVALRHDAPVFMSF